LFTKDVITMSRERELWSKQMIKKVLALKVVIEKPTYSRLQ